MSVGRTSLINNSIVPTVQGYHVNKDSQLTAWGKHLVKIMKDDERIVILSADLVTSCKLEPVLKAFPERIINTGIAEQNMVGLAAGLASEGFKPFIFSFSTFLSMRSCEQIRTDIFYNNLDVKIVGTHAGLSTGQAGPTHFSLEDIGIVRAMPLSRLVVPSDVPSSIHALDCMKGIPGPVYIRLDRNPLPDVYLDEDECSSFQFGTANVLRRGSEGTIFAIGITVRIALDAAEVLDRSGISMSVVDIMTIKPLDEELVRSEISKTPYCVTIEEHSIYGGLGSAIAEVIATEGVACKQRIIGVGDIYPQGGPVVDVRRQLGLSKENLIKEIRDHLGQRSNR